MPLPPPANARRLDLRAADVCRNVLPRRFLGSSFLLPPAAGHSFSSCVIFSQTDLYFAAAILAQWMDVDCFTFQPQRFHGIAGSLVLKIEAEPIQYDLTQPDDSMVSDLAEDGLDSVPTSSP